jgi:hypothetical protein
MKSLSVCAALAAVCASAGLAQATVFDYSNFKSRFATQTGTGVLSGYVYQGFQRVVGILDAASAGEVTVTTPSAEVRTMVELFPGYFAAFSAGLTSEAELDAWLPGGDYTFRLTGGTLGDSVGTVTVPETNLWTNAPMVLNWNDLQNAQAGVGLFVDISDFVVAPGTNDGGFFWTLRDLTAGTAQSFFQSFSDPSEFTIDGSLLIGGHNYSIDLLNSAKVNNGIADGALADGIGFVSFDTVVEARFTVVPAPGAAGLLGAAALLTARRRRAN